MGSTTSSQSGRKTYYLRWLFSVWTSERLIQIADSQGKNRSQNSIKCINSLILTNDSYLTKYNDTEVRLVKQLTIYSGLPNVWTSDSQLIKINDSQGKNRNQESINKCQLINSLILIRSWDGGQRHKIRQRYKRQIRVTTSMTIKHLKYTCLNPRTISRNS